ncbi:MAG: TatD family hydrolase [Lachnospiraceae bacterium]|nr:TatD family hydrolase [Lachnospiraceae bacterium]
MTEIFETHAHFDDARFDPDREELLGTKLPEAGIRYAVNIAADMESVKTTAELTQKYDYIYGALGVHPESADSLSEEDILVIKELALSNKKIRAIGEAGFDLQEGYPPKEIQEKWFRRQIRLSKELDLPLVVHSREAAADTYRVLSDEFGSCTDRRNGIVHCFSYAPEEAEKYIRLGFVIGVGGVVTFKNGKKLKSVVKEIPIEKIVLETDCPYLAPVPFRGERNSSLNLVYIAREIAQIKEISYEETCQATFENAKLLYGIG